MPTVVVLAVAAVALAVIVLLGRTFFKYRGDYLVTCPANQRPAGVKVNAGRAVLTGKLRLETCTRWPEKAGCGQECVRQIEERPSDCLVRDSITRWYHGKTCAYCGRPVAVDWAAHKPALRTPEGQSVSWEVISVEHLLEVLATYQPVCWGCHVANRFVADHPDMAVDRSVRAQK